jgi:hypothetical protein
MTHSSADGEAIVSQLHVWPFLSTIMAFDEWNINPGHHFAGIKYVSTFLFNYIPRQAVPKSF